MKRLLTFAVLTLLTISSSFAAEVRDHRKTTTKQDLAGPVVRDHRKPTVVAPTTTGPTIRDHRTTQPYVVNGNSGAVVRDHRTVTSNSGSGYKVPPVYPTTTSGPVVRDHRNGAGSSGGVTVTSSPRPRQPNILIGNQPTVGGVVKGIGSSISDAGSAVMDGLGKVGNVFGIGYGEITPAKPSRPQVIDHRRK